MASTPWVLIMVESRLLSVEHERADVESIHSSVSELQLRKRSCCEFRSPMKVYVRKLLKLNLYFILNSMTHSRFFFFGKGEATACGRLHFTVFSKTSQEPGVLCHQAVQKLYAISPDTIQAPR
ncbi:hypothetical protein SELMODRAFT_432569, partial [Selaginella moellendorffii]